MTRPTLQHFPDLDSMRRRTFLNSITGLGGVALHAMLAQTVLPVKRPGRSLTDGLISPRKPRA